MIPPRPTALLHTLLHQIIRPGDTVIDATAGNGHDTVFLAQLVGERGRVLAFDIQAAAIQAAAARVEMAGLRPRVTFHHASHAQLLAYCPVGTAAAVIFNLGYLPGEDHAHTTEAAVTLAALDAATGALQPGGTLAITCYPGHPAGATEAAAVEAWLATLTSRKWRAAKYAPLGTLRPAPFLLLAARDA